MRIGDFAVEVVSRGQGVGVRETTGGHVFARPGQVYALRIRNFGPLRCVADVNIDGRCVTAGGLVIEAGCTEELERPITSEEDGRFTVVAEGDERVFGPDGGRDNPDLGLIEVRFRRELPGGPERARPLPSISMDTIGGPTLPVLPSPSRLRPDVFPSWNVSSAVNPPMPNGAGANRLARRERPIGLIARHDATLPDFDEQTLDDVERAAGTGLTGHSTQRFRPTKLGPLEQEATVIQLRLVIASADVIASAAAPGELLSAPARPAARP